MELGQTTQMRWARSLAVAALTACSASVAHVTGGGHHAPVLLLVALVAIGTPILFALSGRRWRFSQLVAVMGLAQLALHVVMSMSMPTSSMTMAHDPSASTVSSDGTSLTMAATHIGVTLAFAALLAHGERLLAWTLRVFVPALAARAFGVFTVRRNAFDAVRAPRLVDLRAPRASRGPPATFVLAP